MKKQILILFMALFALSATQVYAQGPTLTPTELECIDLDDPLNVVAGASYTYSVNVNPPDNNEFHWFVTQDFDFIVDGVLNHDAAEEEGGPILASGEGHYDEATANMNSIELTFQSFSMDEHEHVFVVVWVEHDGTDGCPTDNLKVYRIQPLHAFTLDIANIDPGQDDNQDVEANEDFEVCVDDVQSAIWNDTLGGVVYDFGQNEFLYVVAAANFSGAYQLSARFSGLQGGTDGTTGQSAYLYYDDSFTNLQDQAHDPDTPTGIELTENTTVDFNVLAEDGAVGADGQMLYIKIVIEHNSFEAADDPYDYDLEIDGVLAELDADGNATNPEDWSPVSATPDNSTGDLVDVFDGADECIGAEYEAFAKASIQTLLPRPLIESETPDDTNPVDFEPIVN